MLHRSTLAASFFAIAASACGSTSQPACRVGADCASGACDSSGRCVAAPPGPDGGGPIDGAAPDGGGDASPPSDASFDSGGDGGGDDGGSTLCTPNHDGSITSKEVPLGPGLYASFAIAENVTVSTAGAMQPDGSRTWDLSMMLAGDHTVKFDTIAPAGQWFASDFAQASYATRLSDTQSLLGVFQTSDAALLLQGVVSPSSGSQQTKLTYSPNVSTLAFPFMQGSSWRTNAQVSGTAQGVPVVYAEGYQSNVDAHGTMKTPYAATPFDVLRIKTVLTRNTGGVIAVVRTFTFMAECFGPVATIVSQNDEPNDEFTNAAEVRRLAP